MTVSKKRKTKSKGIWAPGPSFDKLITDRVFSNQLLDRKIEWSWDPAGTAIIVEKVKRAKGTVSMKENVIKFAGKIPRRIYHATIAVPAFPSVNFYACSWDSMAHAVCLAALDLREYGEWKKNSNI